MIGSNNVEVFQLKTELEKARSVKQEFEDRLGIVRTENEELIQDISSLIIAIETERPQNLMRLMTKTEMTMSQHVLHAAKKIH